MTEWVEASERRAAPVCRSVLVDHDGVVVVVAHVAVAVAVLVDHDGVVVVVVDQSVVPVTPLRIAFAVERLGLGECVLDRLFKPTWSLRVAGS